MRTFAQGIAAIRQMDKLNSDIDSGRCKQRTREAFAVPSNGTATAASSWAHAPDQHRDTNPANAPANSFGWMTGGGQGAGHVVVCLGAGRILTPGGPADPDSWYETTAGVLLAGWPNLQWVGWTRTIDGKAPAQAAPIPAPQVPAPRKAPARWARFFHLTPYYIGDSLDGLRRGRRKGYTAVDLDTHMTADHVWANVHWGDLREHPVHRHLVDGKISKTPWAQVARARSKDGHRIRHMAAMLTLAKREGYTRVEVEPKDVPTVDDFRRLRARAEKVGISVVVKRLSDIPGAAECLHNATVAGLPTMLLARGNAPLSKARYWPVADYVRGKVRWA